MCVFVCECGCVCKRVCLREKDQYVHRKSIKTEGVDIGCVVRRTREGKQVAKMLIQSVTHNSV